MKTSEERKTVTLFEKFGIPTPENFEDYNLIGIDFGDGELSASFVAFERVTKENDFGDIEIDENKDVKMTVLPLKFDRGGTIDKNVNAFYQSPTKTGLIYDVNDTKTDSEFGADRYYNYKKCPGDSAADSAFQKDDKTKGSMTYRHAMIEGFNCVVDTLFTHNLRISREKPTIILVGRPSSAGWESSELEYAKMLRKGLRLPERQKEVYIAIQPESTAALASEMDPSLEEKRVKNREIVVVLDSGSSTFDITVVGPGGVVGEDSYQFGGNQLDENLMTLLRWHVAEYSPFAELETEHGHKLALRILKENYYGIKGKGKMAQLYQPDLKNVGEDQDFEFRVDKKTMKKAMEEMPVRAFRFEKGINGMPRKTNPVRYNSWIHACEEIYSSFYDKMRCHFTKQGDEQHSVVPDRIILSGGVSVMPEVQEAVTRAFGVKPTVSSKPNYSVSQGLGYVLGTEVRKKQLLDSLIHNLDSKLPSADSLRNKIGDAAEEEEWESFSKAMEDWANSSTNYSAKNAFELWNDKYFKRGMENVVETGTKNWYKQHYVDNVITNMLRTKFNTLFEDFEGQFNFVMPNIDLSKLPKVNPEIIFAYSFFFQDLITRDNWNIPRDIAYRKHAYEHFISIENKVRKGGTITIQYSENVEVGALWWRHTATRIVSKKEEYCGIRSMYLNDTEVTPVFAKEARDYVKKLLHNPLKDFVESITPYFNMTAQQSMDSKV